MKMHKRQVVLAALVVALGAAVYLNWQFSDGEGSIRTQPAAASRSDGTLGQAQLVNASAAVSSSSAAPVSSAGTEQGNVLPTASASQDDYYTQARLDRQKARDEAAELIEQTLEDAQASDQAKKEAVDQAAELAQNQLKESNTENLLKAKGFADCIVFLQGDTCSVVLKPGSASMEEDAAVVKDAVTSQTGVSYDKIQIVEQE